MQRHDSRSCSRSYNQSKPLFPSYSCKACQKQTSTSTTKQNLHKEGSNALGYSLTAVCANSMLFSKSRISTRRCIMVTTKVCTSDIWCAQPGRHIAITATSAYMLIPIPETDVNAYHLQNNGTHAISSCRLALLSVTNTKTPSNQGDRPDPALVSAAQQSTLYALLP